MSGAMTTTNGPREGMSVVRAAAALRAAFAAHESLERSAFEDACWQKYLDERARRKIDGDVADEHPDRQQLFWRKADGKYGVAAFEAAWWGWQEGRGRLRAQELYAEPEGASNG